MKHFVYIIGPPEDLYPYLQSYVGVTSDINRRWKNHIKSNYNIGKIIRERNWTYDINCKIILEDTSENCFMFENKLRPLPMLGLNEATGGKGGYTKYDQASRTKRSLKLKGKKRTQEFKNYISKLKKKHFENPINNPNASNWKFISPEGNIFIIKGSFRNFCDTNNLAYRTLANNIGKYIPPLPRTSYGGYRPKSPEHRIRRDNTTGWIVIKLINGE